MHITSMLEGSVRVIPHPYNRRGPASRVPPYEECLKMMFAEVTMNDHFAQMPACKLAISKMLRNAPTAKDAAPFSYFPCSTSTRHYSCSSGAGPQAGRLYRQGLEIYGQTRAQVVCTVCTRSCIIVTFRTHEGRVPYSLPDSVRAHGVDC